MKCEICECVFGNLDKHHIHSKRYGGDNKSSNIAKVCPNCHRQVHIGQVIIEGRFASTSGNILIFHAQGEESVTGFAPPVHLHERKT